MKNSEELDKKYSNFGKKVLKAVPHLFPYVKNRLLIAENSGIIPRNMYKSAGIIDDSVVNLYDEIGKSKKESDNFKLKLFLMVNNRLDEIFKKESFHKNTFSTSQILAKELQQMDEKYEMDLDWDLLMPDELDDISYHQDDRHKPLVVYEDDQHNIIKTLEVLDIRGKLSEEKRKILNAIYNWLPFETSNILDLHVLGKLSYPEISSIKNLKVSEVESIISTVRKSFRKNLN